MSLPRRQFLHLAAGAAALPAVSRIARAQAYPTRPVRVIVPFAPAGTTDIAARLMGQLAVFRAEIARSWHRVVNRRSQKANLTRARMDKLIDDWLPKPRILHPWPDKRFAVTHPRWEPWDSCMYGSERGARGNSRPYRTRREFITLLGGATQQPKAARELAERPLG